MIDPVTTAKFFATFGNNSSLIPLGIKDISNILGMTAGSYITGKKAEGQDRFIDEMGTSIIWLMGIPFFKKVIDLTVYKIAKLNPNIDVRILKDPKIFQKAKEYALPGIEEGFKRVEKNKNLFKGLALSKFAVSTILTLASYWGLTVFRHKHTEKTIIKELKKEESLKKENNEFVEKEPLNDKQQKNPSFGLSISVLDQFMFNPVKNTMVIDAGITTERFTESRNPQDFLGYGIKEGGFLFFMYLAGPRFQKYIEKKSAEKNKPIDLDIRILQDENFKKAFADKSIEKHLADFSIEGADVEIYEQLFKKGDNLIVQMAKKTDIIKTAKNSDKIDSQYFIDIVEIKKIKQNIENLYKKVSTQSEKGLDDFFKEIIKLKRTAIIKNMAISIGALGVLVPGIMVAARFLNKDNKEFQVKKEIREKMKRESYIA